MNLINPNKISFHLTKAAKNSLRTIAHYTHERWGEIQRNKYLHLLNKNFHAIAQYPFKGKLRNELKKNLRSSRAGNHHIFYILQNDTVIIVDILHKKMDPVQHVETVENLE